MLRSKPDGIDTSFLMRYPSFAAFQRPPSSSSPRKVEVVSETPDEVVENAVNVMLAATAQDLLTRIMASTPSFFEALVD